MDSCHWHLFEKGPAILMNDGYCGYAYMAQKLSANLTCPVMVLFTYDGSYWGYFLWEKGAECDRFQSCPDYFGPGIPPRKPGNADLIAQTFGVGCQSIENYLCPWEKAKRGCRAYERDTAVSGDCMQFADFMSALGFDFGLLEQ